MSLANAIGNNDFATAFDARKAYNYLSKTNVPAQLLTCPVGAPPLSNSNSLSVPYLTATDIIHASYAYGGTATGPITFAISNAGLQNASVVMSPGTVAGASAVYNVLIAQGPNSN